MTLPESSAPQQQQAQVAAHQAPAVASPSSAPSGGSKVDENLTCQWTNCSEKFDTAEDLYNHLCDIHVGRKSTNNLCLTCAWGACRTTTVKRDHITSHIRVHVPLKPHKCEFCRKAFKRPQDLKKHVKTHADDSVLLRSPEPDGTGRRQSGVAGNLHAQYTTGVGMQPLAATAAQAYYGMLHHEMAGIPSHGVPGLGSYYPNNAPQSSGGVYYYPHSPQTGQEVIAQAAQAAAAQAQAAQAAQQQQQQQQHQEQQSAKKRSFDGVDQFFDDAKRHKIQPVYDGAMAHRLSALQFVPSTTGEGVDFNGSATVTAPATTGGPQTYTLPSLRTKQDLIDADHFLTQLSANVYDSSGQQFQFRAQASQSPHTPNGQAPQPSPQQQHDGAPPAPMGQQNSSGTTSLTPPQGNFATSHSPVNQSPQQVSPQTSNASMYPSLPTAVSSGDVGGGYSAPVSSAPASSLGTNFESNEARRYPVGVLRKAKEVEMDYEASTAKDELSDSMIDPSLGALAEDQAEKTSHAEVINSLRNYIKELLHKEEEREKNGDELQINAEAEAARAEQEDHAMGDAPDAEQAEVSKESEEQTDAQALYPILKAVAAC